MRRAGVGVLDSGQRLGDRGPQLHRVRQPSRLVIQPLLLAHDRPDLLDLAHQVPEVIRPLRGFVAPAGQVGDRRTDRLEFGVRGADSLRHLGCAGQGVEHVTLGVLVQQRLGFVLAVEVHQQAAHRRQRRRGHGDVVDPGATLPRRRHLATQHQQAILRLDAAFVEDRLQHPVSRGVEHAFHHGPVRPAPHDVRAAAFPQQQP